MRNPNLSKRLACCTTALLTGFAGAACNAEDTSSPKTAEDYDSVARAMGPTVADENGGETRAMSDVADITLGNLPLGFTVAASGHVTGSLFGIDYDYAVECSDASGDLLLICGADTTSSAAASLRWDGQITLPNFGLSVERTGDWTIEDLQTDVATFDGASSFHYDGTITLDGTQREYQLDVSASYDAVRITTASREVQSGTISYEISAERSLDGTVTASFDMDAVLDLEADGSASLTLDDDHRYDVDLHTGAVINL